MKNKELEYNFHDSIIISCEEKGNNQFVLVVKLYETLNQSKGTLKIVFYDVFNHVKLLDLFNSLIEDNLEPYWNGTRINSLHYDSKKISGDSNLYIFLHIDGFKPMRIHCKDMMICTLDN
jgi:hypothetical protein